MITKITNWIKDKVTELDMYSLLTSSDWISAGCSWIAERISFNRFSLICPCIITNIEYLVMPKFDCKFKETLLWRENTQREL